MRVYTHERKQKQFPHTMPQVGNIQPQCRGKEMNVPVRSWSPQQRRSISLSLFPTGTVTLIPARQLQGAVVRIKSNNTYRSVLSRL